MIKLRVVIIVALGMFAVGNICCWDTRPMNHDKAIVKLTSAIQQQPSNGSLYFERGKVYENKGAYDEAVADYTKAIELNPNDDKSFVRRGNVYYYEILDHKKALDDYMAALRINPKNKAAKEFLVSWIEHFEMFLKYREQPFDSSFIIEEIPDDWPSDVFIEKLPLPRTPKD